MKIIREEVERKEDYERQYENFLKVLADFNNSKPLKEGLDDDLGSPHSSRSFFFLHLINTNNRRVFKLAKR